MLKIRKIMLYGSVIRRQNGLIKGSRNNDCKEISYDNFSFNYFCWPTFMKPSTLTLLLSAVFATAVICSASSQPYFDKDGISSTVRRSYLSSQYGLSKTQIDAYETALFDKTQKSIATMFLTMLCWFCEIWRKESKRDRLRMKTVDRYGDDFQLL